MTTTNMHNGWKNSPPADMEKSSLNPPARWALVTAGAQGLGRAITTHLLEQGYGVFLHYHTSQKSAERILRAHGTEPSKNIHLLKADLCSKEARVAVMKEVRKVTDTLHVMVHNLGVYPMKEIEEIGIELWDRTFELTCTQVFHLTQMAWPLLQKAGHAGRWIAIGDSGCDRIEARAMATPYHVAKLGVHVLTRTYAQRFMNDGVTANMISPGFLENSVGQPTEPLRQGQRGQFQDILHALDFVLSPKASSVSGANLLVSGAWNLG